jgi:chemotaxis methyl-accepting protein methylase
MAGRYDSLSMRRGLVGNWESLRTQYFTQTGPVCVLSPEIRKRVAFERQNLQDSFEKRGAFDLVLLRYVAIYFATEFKEQLWPRMLRMLTDGGRLVLGATEAIPNGIVGMVSERSGRAYVYRRTDEEGRI